MSDAGLLNELLDPFTECLDETSAQHVANFPIALSVQQRVSELAERANGGLLATDEQADYEALINAADFTAILKLKARRLLRSNPGS